MIIVRTVDVIDPLARANVIEALAGPGAPVGMLGCVERGSMLELRFDDARTSALLVDALVAIESTFVPARAAAPDRLGASAEIAARGLGEPALDEARVIETFLR